MKRMKIATTIDIGMIPVSADDWELYTASMDCDEAAQALTKALEEAVNACAAGKKSYEAMTEHFYPVARKHADWGACDSEPLQTAQRILDKIQALTSPQREG